MSLTLGTLDNSSTDQHSAIKSKILNSIDKTRKNKKHADLDAITKHILKTETSNLDHNFIDTIISELNNQNLIENRRTPQGLDSFWRVLSISPEEEEVPHMEDVIMLPPSPSNLTVSPMKLFPKLHLT